MNTPSSTGPDYPITPVALRAVSLRDAFWLPRLETNRTVTIPDVLRKCEEFGRVDNFRKAAHRMPGAYRGTMPFEDTDVYKAIEGASLSLVHHPDAALLSTVDALVAEIAAAQEADGYLYTSRTIDPRRTLPFSGPERWSHLVMSHELYNCGHLYEAAAAHYTSTGSRALLDVALKSAGLLKRVFGPAGRHDACGHQIVEKALAQLSRITGDRSLLELARFFLEQRGRHESRPLYQYEGNPGYCQDHLPVAEQREAVGHAVRAAYMYAGMADVAARGPDPAYAEALRAIWRNVLDCRIYLTGGIGARHRGESFGEPFELPNLTAYCETCAAMASVMWNQRMFLLTGDSRAVDVLEQTLYNAVLAGVSLRGDEYFYTNPLESDGKSRFNDGATEAVGLTYGAVQAPGRQPWYTVSCCPTGLSRFLPSLPGYQYAVAGNTVYANLFIAGRAEIPMTDGPVVIEQETSYPWDGAVRFTVGVPGPRRMRLLVRIPGWARGEILGGRLYRFQRPSPQTACLNVNGQAISAEMEGGYAVIDRQWNNADRVDLSLPLPIRKVLCDPRVEDNRGAAALQRGPLVYCVEERDCSVPFDRLAPGEETDMEARRLPDLLGGIVGIRGDGFTAIPYYAWANRGPGRMRVWLPDAAERES